MNEKEFVLCLERQKDLIGSKLATAEQKRLPKEKKIEVLDSVVELLGSTLFQALELSTSRTENSEDEKPW